MTVISVDSLIGAAMSLPTDTKLGYTGVKGAGVLLLRHTFPKTALGYASCTATKALEAHNTPRNKQRSIQPSTRRARVLLNTI